MHQIDWAEKQEEYESSDWSVKASIFAVFAVTHFPKNGSILELGAGVGQDSAYFADKGFKVTATDKTIASLSATVENLNDPTKQLVNVRKLDLTKKLEFNDASLDILYAHLSLHYFDYETTNKIFSEIYRVLKPGGVLAFLTNSTNDPEYNTGTQIEKDYFLTEGDTKRYFSIDSALVFASSFHPIIADDKGETYKDMAKGVHKLIRFIGTKPN